MAEWLDLTLFPSLDWVQVEVIYRILERLAVDKVPSWFPAGFSLLTYGEARYVVY